MKKRILSVMISLAMCLSFLPTAAGAEENMDPVNYLDAEGKLQTCTNYTNYDSNSTNWESGWYVMATNGMANTITISGDVHLILADGCIWGLGGIQGDGSLTVYGQSTEEPGSMTVLFSAPVDDEHCGININDFTMNGGNVRVVEKLGDDGSIIESDPTDDRNSYAIYADNFTMNGGHLEVFGSKAKGDSSVSCGLYANNITVNGGRIEANGNTANGDNSMSCGIYAYSDITVNGGKIEAEGGTIAGLGNGDSGTSTGIYAERCDLNINEGTVTATGANITGMSYGIYIDGYWDDTADEWHGYDFNVSGGTVIAHGGATSYSGARSHAGSYGIDTCGFTVTNGSVTASGSSAEGCSPESYGISTIQATISSGSVEATGGTVTETTETENSYGAFSYGIYVDSFADVSGGSVTANGGAASTTNKYSGSYGIYTGSTLTIADGTVTAIGNTATSAKISSESYGVFSDDTVTISNGRLLAQASDSASNYKAVGVAPSENLILTGSYQWRTSADGEFTDGNFDMSDTAPDYLEIESSNVTYGILINGTPVTEGNKDNVLGNGAISYDPDSNTITAKTTATVMNFLGDLVVKGNGSTDIVITNDSSPAPTVGALTITGAKDVTITSNSSYAAVVGNTDITCTGNVNITKQNGGPVVSGLTVKGAKDVVVTVTATDSTGANSPAIGGGANINCSGNITISNTNSFCVGGPLVVNGAKDVVLTANNSDIAALSGGANITCTGDVKITNQGKSVGYALIINSARNVVVEAACNNPAIDCNADISCLGNVTISNTDGYCISGDLNVTKANDVTLTANHANPVICGTADITCSGNMKITNTTGMVVGSTLSYKDVNKHGYVVKTGTDLASLTDFATKAAGETFGPQHFDGSVHALQILTTHTIEHVDAKPATCTENGNKEHWKCSVCGKLFSDEGGTTEVNEDGVLIPVADHTTGSWSSDSTQHWKTCSVCKVEVNKADHSFSGSTCTVCGYTKSSGGSSSSGDGSSSGGGGGSSSSSGTTTKNPDGSTTTTTTDKTTGTVTETTKNTDGSTTTVETKKDGSVTETVKTTDGTSGTVITDKNGTVTEAKATISNTAAKEASKSGKTLTLPVEVSAAKNTGDAPFVEINMPKNIGSVKVEIPVEKVTPGTVAVIVNGDGTEKIVSTSVVTDNGVALKVDGSTTVKIIDNAKSFSDVPATNVFFNEISSLSARNIMIGVSNEKFNLSGKVTLDQIANVAGRITGAVDVADFKSGIAWGKTNGLKSGSDSATRGDVLKALYIAAGSPTVTDTSILAQFKDSVPEELKAIAAWAAQNGILKGSIDSNGALKANLDTNVTRGQACALAGRALNTLS